jgi:hypothetical protein
LKQNHEVLLIVLFLCKLQFIAHAVHVLIADDDNVEVADDICHEPAVVDAADDLRTDAAAELIALLYY